MNGGMDVDAPAVSSAMGIDGDEAAGGAGGDGSRVGTGAKSCEMGDEGGAASESADTDSEAHMNGDGVSSGDDSATSETKVGREDRMQAPVVKLSLRLIDTYNHINQVYYQKQKEKAKKNEWDDKNCDYIIRDGDMVDNGRYRLIKVIGSGSFGQVVKAIDTHANNVEVAIKVIKNKPAFHRQAKMEVELLQYLNGLDPASIGGRDPNIVQLKAHFVHRDHMCLVFELLSYNLYDLLRLTKFRGVSLNLVRKFAKQIITSLLVLAQSNIIHCDLKPENILLRHPKRSAIKVIDFGSSCRDSRTVYTYIQSRYYRAPEVILGTRYDVAIDMWSLGCTLIEMHTGEPLFGGANEGDQLRKIVETLGPLPPAMCERASAKKKPLIPHDAVKIRDLTEVIRDAKMRNCDKEDHTDEDYHLFLDLVVQMLTYEPADRIPPLRGLQHPFLQGHSPRHPSAGAPPTTVAPPPPVQQAWSEQASERREAAGGAAPAVPPPVVGMSAMADEEDGANADADGVVDAESSPLRTPG